MTTSRTTSTLAAIAALALGATGVALDQAASAAGTAAVPDTANAHHAHAPATPAPMPAANAGQVEPYAYRWPLKPFDRQHPVRGFFGDPRIANHGESRQFHFGVDISAPNGTAVYATQTGRVYIHPLHPTTVAIVAPDDTEFSYWHVVPSVRAGDHVVAYRTVIGHVEAPYGHVHFSERRDDRYLNPLRRGAMGPYADATTPVVRSVRVAANGELVAEAYDETPIAIPRPWHDLPVMPAVVRWRVVTTGGDVLSPWRTSVDFRETIPDASRFDRVWADGVTQNHVRAPGRFRLALASSDEVTTVGRTSFVVEIAASDTRDNRTRTRFRISLSAA